MNRLTFSLIILLFGSKLLFAQDQAFPFETSLESAKAKAKKEQKGIFVLYYAEWCGFCQRLQEEVLPDELVKAEMDNAFVSYRVLNNSEEGKSLKSTYGIRSLPTLLFFDEKGEIKTLQSGFMEKEALREQIRKVYKYYYFKDFPELELTIQPAPEKEVEVESTQPAQLMAKTSTVCDDSNPCTDDFFNETTGLCEYSNNTASCNDGNPCSVGDACSDGVCVGGSSSLCDDGNPCTEDICNPSGGCTYINVSNGTACDDGNNCTTGESCSDGQCLNGTPEVCPEDSNVCTDAVCDGTEGCIQVNNTAACDDGNPATINDVCFSGVCVGTPVNCDDGNPCTDDSYNPLTGGCEHANNTVSCNDGDVCTVGDACSDGVCVGGSASFCDDGNPCTQDICDPLGGCTYVNVSNGQACDDGDNCTIGESCSDGLCTNGTPEVCPDDSNVCTDAVCDGTEGCIQVNNTAACDDGDPSTINDNCNAGVCAGQPVVCDDNNLCTTDSYNPTTGNCEYVNNTLSCDDGNACTTGDACSDGACNGINPLNCDDNNRCTIDDCNPLSGCSHIAIANNTTLNGIDYPGPPPNTIISDTTVNTANYIGTFDNPANSSDPGYQPLFIDPSVNVELYTGKAILLRHGFEVKTGATFVAEIRACTN